MPLNGHNCLKNEEIRGPYFYYIYLKIAGTLPFLTCHIYMRSGFDILNTFRAKAPDEQISEAQTDIQRQNNIPSPSALHKTCPSIKENT